MTDNTEDSELHPRHTAEIFGHEEAERLLLADFNRDKLPGAYLFSGPKGIGKASMAYRFARFLLATPMPGTSDGGLFGEALPPILPATLSIDPQHPVARRIASRGHMNLLAIERSIDEKTKKLRGEIVVEDVRKIGNFLSKSAAEEGWRIVIIDTADEMNNNAANAILKWLEEPPERALFLLVASQPGALLPTIRSRCRTVTFRPPSQEGFSRIVSATLGEMEASEMEHLYFLSGGAPGWALTLQENGIVKIYEDLLELYQQEASPLAFEAFAEQVTAKKKDSRFSDIAAMLLAIVAGVIRHHEGMDAQTPEQEQRVFARLAAKKPLDYWLNLWEKSASLLSDTQRVHLDQRGAVAGITHALAGHENILNYMRSGS